MMRNFTYESLRRKLVDFAPIQLTEKMNVRPQSVFEDVL